MITQVRGCLRSVGDEEITLDVAPFQIAVLVSDHDRRRLAARIGEAIDLFTICYLEGNNMSSRMNPRLVGFLDAIDREFFDTFCSVDGVGVKKALRAMVRPVREIARAIEDQDVKMLSTFPGVGEATAERIVAKLRRKVGKFALIVSKDEHEVHADSARANGVQATAEPDVVRETYEALRSVGHSESDARRLIDTALASKKKFKSVADLIEAIYRRIP